MSKEKFVRAYMHGWYDHGRMMGDYLWDVEMDQIESPDIKLLKETAEATYDRMYGTV